LSSGRVLTSSTTECGRITQGGDRGKTNGVLGYYLWSWSVKGSAEASRQLLTLSLAFMNDSVILPSFSSAIGRDVFDRLLKALRNHARRSSIAVLSTVGDLIAVSRRAGSIIASACGCECGGFCVELSQTKT
jgi:hypothetical protein